LAQPVRNHGAIWVRQLAAELDQKGHRADRLLRKVGLNRKELAREDARIPFARHAAFFELAAAETENATLGFDFGRTRDTRDAGLIGYVGLSSPTVIDALKNFARYRRVFSDAAAIDADGLERNGRLAWGFIGIGDAQARQSTEFAVTNFVRALREASGKRIAPTGLSFAHARSGSRAEIDAYFGCRIAFGAEANSVTFAPEDLRMPLVSADSRLLVILRGYCEDVLARHAERPPPLVERIEHLVTERLANGEATLAEVASAAGMSKRSLSRKLGEQGASFKGIVDALRRELAITYLKQSNLTLTEIAFLLGYGELSSFNHAFRRWTGHTPSIARAQYR